MGRIDSAEILLDGNKENFVTGDTVSGQVQLLVSGGDTEITSLFLQLVGKAFCIWREGKYTYQAKENTYDQVQTLHGKGAADANRTGPLAQGAHIIPFKYQLTGPLVSTCQDPIGYVKYSIKLKLTRPMRSILKVKRRITVREHLDLSHFQNMSAPSGGLEETTVCCGCCSGPVEGEVHTARTGCVPGDWILSNATMTNNSSSKVKRTTLGIARRVHYITPFRRRKEHYTVVEQIGPPCDPGKTVHLNNIKLQVPDTVPTNTSLKIMKFEYAVLLRGYLRDCTSDSRTFAPITIGSAPSPNPSHENVSDVTAGAAYPALESLTGGQKQGVANETFYDWNQSAFTYK